ncbi:MULTISPECIES: endo-1,4-beta-xylanase [Cryobacterium]|uniref:endo-1,4-beta-xylanase n=1 Tax=Cryobacterium TaxID=69578 RepID=UPI000CD454AE|nr:MULTISPECIES: endo-1,4-beta-xylanase [Cryobacterium]POH63596.1 1,4-beta-xylanase [Cryobacterium zongtaii]TFC42067.1 1,4-beta-xylanase [Cryobacterium sp. TMN-39-2]
MPDFTHRIADARVRLVDSQGRPIAGAEASVEQTRQAFGFGNIGFDFIDLLGGPPGSGDAPPEPEALAEAWLGLFNTMTLPFYWRGFEPVQGQPDTTRLRRTAEWFAERGVTVKGHPLLWHTLAPEWLLSLDDAEVEKTIRERIRREVTDFAGVVDLWDAINEVVILPVFTAEDNAVTRLSQRRGRVGMVRLAFEEARAANPNARLVLNDFDLSADYEHVIEDCLTAGIRIDAIGLQTHMHQGYRGEEQVWGILERFARFGLPLQLTETTLLSGDLMPPEIVDLNDFQPESWPSTPEGEARQADEIVRHYRTVVSHPAVESLTYWGLTDHGAWLGAPSGLIRRDGSKKPAYDALQGLVRGEWWHPETRTTTDADGVVMVRGFAGRYRMTTPVGSAEVELGAGVGSVTVMLDSVPAALGKL